MGELGQRIKNLREAKGMTQTELAKKSGVTWSAISKYERGVVDNLPYDRMVMIAKALNTTPNYLLYGSNLVVTEETADDYNPFYDMNNDYYGTDIEWRKLHGAVDDRPKLTEIVRLCRDMSDDILDKVIVIIKALKG